MVNPASGRRPGCPESLEPPHRGRCGHSRHACRAGLRPRLRCRRRRLRRRPRLRNPPEPHAARKTRIRHTIGFPDRLSTLKRVGRRTEPGRRQKPGDGASNRVRAFPWHQLSNISLFHSKFLTIPFLIMILELRIFFFDVNPPLFMVLIPLDSLCHPLVKIMHRFPSQRFHFCGIQRIPPVMSRPVFHRLYE